MTFIAKNGRVVTDDMLDRWAEDADNGEFGGVPGSVHPGPVVPVSQRDKSPFVLPTDTVLRSDADFDAFEREILGDDK
ncbi:hypothetical protein [Bifidobacterium miconisargentati]|uniref:hypothetical protein n=1 Tax=Bifidobacterium miconisargentati TaxID=2834437 RepID=UPI001BDDA187|nr:hypothetical protein [Bifidobacterium miconisargentati]MBW3090080.1 hypothetical protein [Bifidobacterium miconisargentati]